jgi:hypothetical protein
LAQYLLNAKENYFRIPAECRVISKKPNPSQGGGGKLRVSERNSRAAIRVFSGGPALFSAECRKAPSSVQKHNVQPQPVTMRDEMKSNRYSTNFSELSKLILSMSEEQQQKLIDMAIRITNGQKVDPEAGRKIFGLYFTSGVMAGWAFVTVFIVILTQL